MTQEQEGCVEHPQDEPLVWSRGTLLCPRCRAIVGVSDGIPVQPQGSATPKLTLRNLPREWSL